MEKPHELKNYWMFSADKLNSVFTLLDAFGNSRTIMNTSATKFSSLFSLDFDHSGQIASASVQVWSYVIMFQVLSLDKPIAL